MKFWITLFRGGFAFALGIALIIQPDKARPILANFMGFFWLASGIISLRWGASGDRARGWLPLLAGFIGVLAGLGMLGRGLAGTLISEAVVFSVVGVIVFLTGLLHMFDGFKQGHTLTRRWSLTSFLLGLFEAILGLILVLEPLQRGPLVYTAASIWAVLGGFILIGDALYIRRQRRLEAPK